MSFRSQYRPRPKLKTHWLGFEHWWSAKESDSVNTSPRFETQAVLVVGLVPHGVAMWSDGHDGLNSKWIEKDPANIRLEAERLAELSSQPSSAIDEIRTPARHLYRTLVEPAFTGRTFSGPLTIQTDESLSRIPFQVLIDDSGQYLEDRHRWRTCRF